MREEETTKTRKFQKSLVVKELSAHFKLRYVPNSCVWNIIVRCRIHNHDLAGDLDGRDILGHLKLNERPFVNDMTKYHIELRFVVVELKDMGVDDLTNMQLMYTVRSTY